MNDMAPDHAAALQVTRALRAAGHQAFWAGGCVRDRKLGQLQHADIDIATDAQPDQIRELFGQRRTIAVGAAFGVIMVIAGEGKPIEVATFRSDASYSDGRHPDNVTFTDAREDAQRRDFTINGMFYDPLSDEYIDHVDGQADLDAGLIRAIGDAEQRFSEDKLRLIRAVRFAAALQFQIEPDTWKAIQRHASEITVVSAERIQSELQKILLHPERLRGIQLLRDSGLLAAVLPELETGDADNWSELEVTLGKIQSPSFPLILAACAASLASETGLETACERLKMSNHDRQLTLWLQQHLPRVLRLHQASWPEAQRLLIEPQIDLLVELADAIGTARQEPQDWHRFCLEKLALPAGQLNPQPLINGDDLLQAGIPAGPDFRMILERVRNAQLEGQLADQHQALAMALKLQSAD